MNLFLGPAPAATPDIDVKKITQQVMEECSRLTLVETNKQKEKVDRRIGKIDSRIWKIDSRIWKIDRKINKIDCRIWKIDSM